MQVVGVVLEFHQAGGHHFPDRIPAAMGVVGVGILVLGVLVGIPADRGEYHFAVVLLEKGKGVQVIVVIPVVKCQHHRLFRKRLSFLHIGDQIRDDDGGIAVFLEIPQILFEQVG